MLTYEDQIQQLKSRVQAMLLSRSAEDKARTGQPSPIWSEMASAFRYLMELSPQSLRNIRFHSELLNGGGMFRYWHPWPPIDPLSEANSLGYSRMIRDIPERYWISEPAAPGIPRPLGVDYRGMVVNDNIARYQNCISILYHARVMEFLEQSPERSVVVEIGGGYGGLTHALQSVLGGKATCVVVDIPEILLFSGAYLIANNPDKSVWIYDENEAAGGGLKDKIRDHDFVLLPNGVAERLRELDEITVMINMQSFQEMTESQVIQYLDIAKAKLAFCFYSDNMDCHPYNPKGSSIAMLLKKRFELFPDPQIYSDYFKGLDPKSYVCYHKFLAQPAGAKTKINRNIPDHLFRPRYLRREQIKQKIKTLEHWVRKIA